MGRLGVDDLEDMHLAKLEPDGIEELLEATTECTLAFTDADGWPRAVVLSFVRQDGRFYLTAVERRMHVRSLRRDPRVTLVVSSTGTGLPGRRMVAIRGRAIVHAAGEVYERMLPVVARRLAPAGSAELLRLLDSEHRVVIEIEPIGVAVSHDSRRVPGDGRGGPSPSNEPAVAPPAP